jgi:hypothetical protein
MLGCLNGAVYNSHICSNGAVYYFDNRGEGDQEDEQVKIVAVDLQAMAPIPGVIQIQGDITKVGSCNYTFSSFSYFTVVSVALHSLNRRFQRCLLS